MYLSRMEIDTSRPATRLALSCPSKFHGAIESSFPGERRRNLWRIDHLNGRDYLMLLSEQSPDLTTVYDQFGFSGMCPIWDSRDYAGLLDRVTVGSRWQFRLVACPVKRSVPAGNHSRGKLSTYMMASDQKEWLLARSEKNGFSLDGKDFDVVHFEKKQFRKGNEHKSLVTLASATFEGILTVKDVALFRKALTEGIGRGKAYGLGMLTIARVQVD